MQSYQFVRQLLNRYRKSHLVVRSACIAVFGLFSLAIVLYSGVPQVHAAFASICSKSERSYTVVPGDTLGHIASRYGVSLSSLASRNAIANPNLIFAGQRVCISSHAAVKQAPAAPGRTFAPAQPASSSVSGLINSVFGAYAGAATQIAICESGLNPNATNPISINGSHAAGVFQILYPSTWVGTSQANSSPYSAYANILAAHEIFVRDGYSWREWSCLA